MTETQEQEERRGRARERQRRRRERKQQATKKTSRSAPQISAPNPVRLPKIRMASSWLRPVLYVLLGVGLISAIVFGLRFVNPPDTETPPNAIWLGFEWSYERPSDAAVAGLVERLREHEIGTSYVWVTYLKADGTWSGRSSGTNPVTDEPYTDTLQEMESNIQAFVSQYKGAYPNSLLYAWVSIPLDVGHDLSDPILQDRVSELGKVLVDSYGFDGIHLNIELVLDGNNGYLELLREVRALLGPEVPLSVAVPPDWRPSGDPVPFGPNITSTYEWTEPYKQSVALLVDEIAIMAYNSGITDPDDYSTWVAYQVQAYANAILDLELDTDLLLGVPTYAEVPGAHDPDAENILTGVRGLRSGLLQVGSDTETVRGLAIYAGWETDPSEWGIFYREWVNQSR